MSCCCGFMAKFFLLLGSLGLLQRAWRPQGIATTIYVWCPLFVHIVTIFAVAREKSYLHPFLSRKMTTCQIFGILVIRLSLNQTLIFCNYSRFFLIPHCTCSINRHSTAVRKCLV